jgi:hypothetical protein
MPWPVWWSLQTIVPEGGDGARMGPGFWFEGISKPALSRVALRFYPDHEDFPDLSSGTQRLVLQEAIGTFPPPPGGIAGLALTASDSLGDIVPSFWKFVSRGQEEVGMDSAFLSRDVDEQLWTVLGFFGSNVSRDRMGAAFSATAESFANPQSVTLLREMHRSVPTLIKGASAAAASGVPRLGLKRLNL